MDGLVIAGFAAKGLDQFDGRTDLAEWVELEDFDVLDMLDAGFAR